MRVIVASFSASLSQLSVTSPPMPQATHQFFHAGQPQYAPPVLRAPSPSSSIGTAYGPDETSLEDRDLGQEAFERRCEDRLRLRQPRPEEVRANEDPLIRPRPKTAPEENGQTSEHLLSHPC